MRIPPLWQMIHGVLSIVHTVVGVYVLAELDDKIEVTKLDVYLTIPDVTIKNGVYSVTNRDESEFKVSPITIHAWVSIITGLSHLCSVLKYSKHGLCPARPNVIRWVEYAVTATLMTLSGFISLGEGNVFFLINITILGIALQSCGYFIEKYVSERSSGQESFWLRYLALGVAIEIAIVVPLVYLTVKASQGTTLGLVEGTVFYGFYYAFFGINAYVDAENISKKNDVPQSPRVFWKLNNNASFWAGEDVWWGAAAAVFFAVVVGAPTGSITSGAAIGIIAFVAIMLTSQQKRRYQPVQNQNVENTTLTTTAADKWFMVTDERYIVLSFTSKMALFWITVGSLIYNISEGSEKTHWFGVLIAAEVVPLCGLVVFYFHQKDNTRFQVFKILFKHFPTDTRNAFKDTNKSTVTMSGIGSKLHF